MANLNKVLLMGNLTRDPELRQINSGMAVCTLGMAVNTFYGKGEKRSDEALFIDVTVWGKTAENCAEYLAKGRPIFVEGRLRFHSWEKNGTRQTKIDVTAQSVQFLGGSRVGQSDKQDGLDVPPLDNNDGPF